MHESLIELMEKWLKMMGKGSRDAGKQEREEKRINMQYVDVPISYNDCIYYLSQTYAIKNWGKISTHK